MHTENEWGSGRQRRRRRALLVFLHIMDTTTTSSLKSAEKKDTDATPRAHSPEIDVEVIKSDCSTPEKQNGAVGNEQQMNNSTSTRRTDSNKNLSPPPQRLRTSSSTSDGTENLISSLSSWDWVTIDGLKLPAVTRNKERYVAVHMVQLKLLSKFPSDIPRDITRKFTMGSHKMTVTEAWTFNTINAVIRKFDLGCQLFTANDELVKLNDVQMFYWNVKLFNLKRVNGQYETAISSAENNVQLLATAMQLKKQVDSDIQVIFK